MMIFMNMNPQFHITGTDGRDTVLYIVHCPMTNIFTFMHHASST